MRITFVRAFTLMGGVLLIIASTRADWGSWQWWLVTLLAGSFLAAYDLTVPYRKELKK